MELTATIELSVQQVRELIRRGLLDEGIQISPDKIIFNIEKEYHGDQRDHWETYELKKIKITDVKMNRAKYSD